MCFRDRKRMNVTQACGQWQTFAVFKLWGGGLPQQFSLDCTLYGERKDGWLRKLERSVRLAGHADRRSKRERRNPPSCNREVHVLARCISPSNIRRPLRERRRFGFLRRWGDEFPSTSVPWALSAEIKGREGDHLPFKFLSCRYSLGQGWGTCGLLGP
jgi:hypothetical protein